MFTQQTICALSSLQDLSYKSKEFQRQTNQDQCTARRNCLLTDATSAQLKQVGSDLHGIIMKALLEGLIAAKPDFVGTPFEQTVNDIIAGFQDGSDRAVLHSSVELAALDRKAGDWLKGQIEAALPKQQYTVESAFGQFIVEATSPAKARLVAAAQHYKCKVDELDGDVLRGFANGVLAS